MADLVRIFNGNDSPYANGWTYRDDATGMEYEDPEGKIPIKFAGSDTANKEGTYSWASTGKASEGHAWPEAGPWILSQPEGQRWAMERGLDPAKFQEWGPEQQNGIANYGVNVYSGKYGNQSSGLGGMGGILGLGDVGTFGAILAAMYGGMQLAGNFAGGASGIGGGGGGGGFINGALDEGLGGLGGGATDFAGFGSGGFAGADATGLAQMGAQAGLSGPALDAFVASGGTLGSTAAGGGGIGTGAAAGGDTSGGFLQNVMQTPTPPVGGGGGGGADQIGSDWATGQPTGPTGGSLPQTAGGLTAANTASGVLDALGGPQTSTGGSLLQTLGKLLGAGGAPGPNGTGAQSLANLLSGLYSMFGKQGLSQDQVTQLFNAGRDTYNTSTSPMAGYDLASQRVQDQARAADSARGVGMSPYSVGNENDAMRKFNIDWTNTQLGRQATGAGAFANTANAATNAFGQNFTQNQVGLNNLQTGLGGVGSWLGGLMQ